MNLILKYSTSGCFIQVVSTISDSTWHVIENTKKVGTEKVNNLLNTRVGKVVTTSMDMALTASDYAIEYYLPPDEEGKKHWEPTKVSEQLYQILCMIITLRYVNSDNQCCCWSHYALYMTWRLCSSNFFHLGRIL